MTNRYGHVVSFAVAALLAAISASAEMTVNVGGRIQVDAALYDEDRSELGSGTEFRRARFFAEGDIEEDWAYKLQVDFADGDVSMKDAYVKYSGASVGDVKIGQFKTPFSLEELMSSKYITFMERGLPNAFASSRRIGIGLERNRDATHFAAALYGDEAGDNPEDEGVGVGARFAYALTPGADRLVHLGVAAALEEPTTTSSNNPFVEDSVRFRSRPESHVTGGRFVDTGDISNVNSVTKLGLESAYVAGPFSAQAEYMTVYIDRRGQDVDFEGFYAYASWFTGGKGRSYKNGVFQRTKVEKAWEFAARYSRMSLNDGLRRGGEENNLTLGLNYYVNPHLRFMANYIRVVVQRDSFYPTPGFEDEPNILQFRAAVDFK